MTDLARAENAITNVFHIRYEQSEARASEAVKCAAESFLEVMRSGKAHERMPIHGQSGSINVSELLTWISTDASKLLLAAVSAAMQGRDGECPALLKSFAAQAAAEYANDNYEVWL